MIIKRLLPLLLALLLILGSLLAYYTSLYLQSAKPSRHAEAPRIITQRPEPLPALLPAREATADKPLQSWERLLVIDGSPAEDRAALADIVANFLQTSAHDPRPPLGTNEEITRALTNKSLMEDTAIPTNHPAIIHGQLVDRWGSPWFFHQLSADVIEVRSTGPDRKLFTPDDIVK